MKKVPFSDSTKILSYIELSPEADEVVDSKESPQKVIATLKKEQLYLDLVHFYAHALPMRESIWWGTLAVRMRHDTLTAREEKILDECVRWVKEPSEAVRRSIELQIATLPNESSVKWLGLSVFWSGNGSIAPIDNPVVMPAEYLYAKAVAGAVNTAAVLPEWSGRKNYYLRAFEMALDLANGGSGVTAGGLTE